MMMMRLAFVAAAVCCAAGAPAGSLVGVIRKPWPAQNDCSLNRLEYETGRNTTIAKVKVCHNATEASSVPVAGRGVVRGRDSIVFTTGTGDYWAIDVATGSETLVAKRASEKTVGIAVHGHTLYVIAADGVWAAGLGGGVAEVARATPLDLEGATGTPASNGTHAFVATGKQLITIDLVSGAVVAQPDYPHPVMDLVYRPGTGDVLALYAYQLFTVDLGTGAQTKVVDIPDGDGFPARFAYDAASKTFFFGDFDYTYSLDPLTGALPTKVVYNSYLVSGNYFFVPDTDAKH